MEDMDIQDAPEEAGFLTPSSSENFTDEQHEQFNKKVTEAALQNLKPDQVLSMFDCCYLLACIIEDVRNLDQRYLVMKNALNLLENRPKLVLALEKAWRTQDYTEIRKSGKLCRWYPANVSPNSLRSALLRPSRPLPERTSYC